MWYTIVDQSELVAHPYGKAAAAPPADPSTRPRLGPSKSIKQYDRAGRRINKKGKLTGWKLLHSKIKKLVLSKPFDHTIIFLIIFSSGLLAVDSPKVNPGSNLKKALNVLDVIFVVIFACEVGMRNRGL